MPRQGGELVEDTVQAGLRTELAEVRRLREDMVILMDTLDTQLAKSQAVWRTNRQDVLVKTEAEGLDTVARQLQDDSARVQAHPGVELEDTTRSTQLSWDQHSDKHLSNSTDARARSLELRRKVEALLQSSCSELMEAWGASNRNFSERILHTEKAQKLSMENLEKTNQEMTNIDHHIKLLKKSIECKCAPRSVAESRLEVRRQRPGQEACGDTPNSKLRQEVRDDTASSACSPSRWWSWGTA